MKATRTSTTVSNDEQINSNVEAMVNNEQAVVNSTMEAMNNDPIVHGDINGFYLTKSEADEFVALTGDEAKRANEYRKECMKKGNHPIPPSQWLVCPACGYRAPESLNTHVTRVHGGVSKMAHDLGVLPETIMLTAPELRAKNAEISKRIAAEKKAAKVAA